jgi:metallo-beta-lactamase family protein
VIDSRPGARDKARMEFEAIGAAQTVTGSMHLLRTKHATVLLDCGLYQGRRAQANAINHNFKVPVAELDAVVLSHAHIDHSGCLPLLAKRGYRGDIWATPATRDLCQLMLEDAAMIQANDARYINRRIERDGADLEPVVPLYDLQDVHVALARMISLPYHRPHLIAPGVRLTFLDAGHVLGSAICVLDVQEDDRHLRVVFTGDLGRRRMPILRDPEWVEGAQVLLMESTYGDRLHPPIEAMEDALAEILASAWQRKGKVIIPSFALERAQEVVLALEHLKQSGRLPPFPVYVDSPLTVKITDVFKMHPECYDEETYALIRSKRSPFNFPGLSYVHDLEESKALTTSPDPAIIISASGMCEAGRVLHHLQAAIDDPRHTVLIVGFQAEHTLGRRLVERRPKVRIFGVERPLNARVEVLNGFSAHADQADLMAFAAAAHKNGPLQQIILVHGEPRPQATLAELLEKAGLPPPPPPPPGDRLPL